jgi:hypothetical protein
MEMCLAWHWPPHIVESWPMDVRHRMLAHFRWRNERRRMARQQQEFEARAAAEQQKLARMGPGRRG